MKSARSFAVLVVAALYASACVQAHDKGETSENTAAGKPVVAAEKPFAGGGKIDLQLDGGAYEVHPAADDRIRVTLSGNIGNAKVELAADGTHADVKVKDTPRNFRAAIEVPKVADLVIRFSGGDLVMAPITGNKDVDSYGGDIKIGVGDPNDYASVDASVKAGDIEAGPFGESKSGLLQHLTWSGHGKYTLRANLGAGNLVFRSK